MHKDVKTMKRINLFISFFVSFFFSFMIPLLFHHCHSKSHANKIKKRNTNLFIICLIQTPFNTHIFFYIKATDTFDIDFCAVPGKDGKAIQ